jgi:hypothetical protein
LVKPLSSTALPTMRSNSMPNFEALCLSPSHE